MNTVTKSGTNRLHGTLFEFYRNQGMDARNYFDPTKAALKRHQYGGVLGGPVWKDKIFFFTDFQQTRQVAGVSTGPMQVMSADERNGIFPDSVLNTVVQGDAWAATLMSRGGGTIVAGSTMYNQLGTPVTTTAIDPNTHTVVSVPGHNISAYIDPVTKLTMPFIPAPNQAGGFSFSDSSHSGSIVDTNMAQRIDFINHMTGDWSFYYHYAYATPVRPICQQAYQGTTHVPGFPATQPSRNQLFSMSNTKTFASPPFNVPRCQLSATPTAPSTPTT